MCVCVKGWCGKCSDVACQPEGPKRRKIEGKNDSKLTFRVGPKVTTKGDPKVTEPGHLITSLSLLSHFLPLWAFWTARHMSSGSSTWGWATAMRFIEHFARRPWKECYWWQRKTNGYGDFQGLLPEWATIAHRHSLANLHRRQGIAKKFPKWGSSSPSSLFANDFWSEGNCASWGLKRSRNFWGAVEVAAPTAEIREI